MFRRPKKTWQPDRITEYRYWYITDGHGVDQCDWEGDVWDIVRYKAGNMFKTRTEARIMRDRVKKLFGKK